MKVVVPVRLHALLRRQAIAAMAREFARSVGVDSEHTLNTIKSAIVDELLRSVEILMFDANGRDQGYVFFEIDWAAHRVVTRSNGSESSFHVDITKNIAEQIAPVVDYVASYLRANIQQRDVVSHTVVFRWAPNADPSRLAALRSSRGLVAVGAADDELLRYYRSRARRWSDGGFSEMSVGGSFRSL